MSRKALQIIFIVLMVMFTTACTSSSKQQQAALETNGQSSQQKPAFDKVDVYVDKRDPFESMNRVLWDFNWNVLDKYLLRPIAVGYTKLPDPAQMGVRNFITNLEEPGYAINSLLQGKVADSGAGVGRFVVNSTIGILGLFDVAKHLGLEQKKESFGETMAVAGVGNGPFFMIPAYGPTTVRDGTGDFVDGLVFPLSLLSLPQSILKTGIKAVYTRADLIQQESLINQSTDSYIFIKEAYFQGQAYKVYNGNPPIPEPTFDDSFLDEID
ncbi:MAG: VacJ family lipoprotein [Gammaproteobacteria bacterium]|nr:VacJ family lipoprotein [Gammaproteobacteria bacterium]